MEFSLKFNTEPSVRFSFDGESYSIYDSFNEEPPVTYGLITDEDDNQIGLLVGYALENSPDFVMKLDNISADLGNLASSVCKADGSVRKKYLSKNADWEPVFILDHLEIEEEYRHKGIGSAIIKNLSKLLRYEYDYGSMIMVCASDFESVEQFGFDSEQYRTGTKKLIDFYLNCGFRIAKENVLYYVNNDI